MKNIISYLALLLLALPAFAQPPTTGQFGLNKKNAGPGYTLIPGPNTPSTLWGFDGSGDLINKPIADLQAADPLLSALASLTTAADKGIYFTASDTPATFDFFNWGRSFLAAATEADGLNTILPQQSGHDDEVLVTNGSSTSWSKRIKGPAGAVAGDAIPVWNGTGGGEVKDSGIAYTHLPLLVIVRNINNQGGAPVDIAAIPLPAWVQKFQLLGTTTQGSCKLYATAVTNAASSGTFSIRTATGGGGVAVSNTAAGPTAAGATSVGIGNAAATTVYEPIGNTLYLYQNTNGTNPVTMDLYLWILPMP